MPAITITDFKVGMSRAGSITALPAGTCWTIKNAHIDRSGRIERTKRWVSYATLPAGTHGLWASKRQLVTFGVVPSRAACRLPSDISGCSTRPITR